MAKLVCDKTPYDLDKLKVEEFHKYWYHDALTDRQMAKMFNTTVKHVREKRKKLKLNLWNAAVLAILGGPKYAKPIKEKKQKGRK